MDLKEVITELGLTKSTELLQALGAEWEASQQSMPAGKFPFLTPEFVDYSCRTMGFPPEVAPVAIATSRSVIANAALRALAWHYHHCLFRCPAYPGGAVNNWPSLTGALQNEAGMFHLLVLLSGLPKMQSIHRAHSVPPDIVHDTLCQAKFTMTEYRKKHGNWGLNTHNLGWFRNHFCGNLYGLGRLQFQFGSFGSRLRAFRHRTSGTVVALSEGGVGYLADGQVNGAGRIYDTTGAWVSQLTFTDDEIIGYPILPTGCALQRKVHLSTAGWHQVLAPGDPVLNLHIPAGSPMAYDLCGESFQAALKFFPQHFPEKPFISFCCGSWLLDSQLEELLPPTSNLVRFQQEVYLFPVLSDDLHLLKAVFGCVPEDLRKAPRDTTLQRALLDRLLAGGHLRARAGGYFLFPEDLNWGAQVYRRQTFPWQRIHTQTSAPLKVP